MSQKVGIVVPTLGKRPDYLIQCLRSIELAGRGANSPHVIAVAPPEFDGSPYVEFGLIDQIVEDRGNGLAEAINLGFRSMPSDIEYINWLGDDDLISKGSLDLATEHLDSHPQTVLVYGGCDYIDGEGRVVWTNTSSPFAVPMLRFGPNLIPQPGALFRKASFLGVGGLDSRYDWAFDFDLLIKLSKIGKLDYLGRTLSSFRWHPESLSVEYRVRSVSEASQVRVSHLPTFLRLISILWEFPVKQATLSAGNIVTRRAIKKAASK